MFFFLHSSNGLNHSKDTFEPNWIVLLPCCNLHSHTVSQARVHYDWQNRKTERFSPKCQGLISAAATQLPPPQSATLALVWFKVLIVVKKGEEEETLHFPFHSPFRGMFKEYFGFWFECPYILFPLLCSYALCGVTVLAGEYPIAPWGLTLSLLKCMRVSRNLFSGGSLSRGQEGGSPLCRHSLLTVTRSMVPAAAGRVKWCHCVISKSSDLQKSLVWGL